MNVARILSVDTMKTFFDFRGNALSISANLLLILSIHGLLPFSGVTLMFFRTESMSFHSRLLASPALIPVSFRSCRKAAVFFPQLAIS